MSLDFEFLLRRRRLSSNIDKIFYFLNFFRNVLSNSAPRHLIEGRSIEASYFGVLRVSGHRLSLRSRHKTQHIELPRTSRPIFSIPLKTPSSALVTKRNDVSSKNDWFFNFFQISYHIRYLRCTILPQLSQGWSRHVSRFSASCHPTDCPSAILICLIASYVSKQCSQFSSSSCRSRLKCASKSLVVASGLLNQSWRLLNTFSNAFYFANVPYSSLPITDPVV